jgi:hypothetical protein
MHNRRAERPRFREPELTHPDQEPRSASAGLGHVSGMIQALRVNARVPTGRLSSFIVPTSERGTASGLARPLKPSTTLTALRAKV